MTTDTENLDIPSISDPDYIKRREGWATEYGIAILYGDVVSSTRVTSGSSSGSLVLTGLELAFNYISSSGQIGMEIIPLGEIDDVSLGSSWFNGKKYLRIVSNSKRTDYKHNPEHAPSRLEDLSLFAQTLIKTKDDLDLDAAKSQEFEASDIDTSEDPKYENVGATITAGITLDIAKARQGLVNGILLLSEKHLTFQYQRDDKVKEDVIPIHMIKGSTYTHSAGEGKLTITWGMKTVYDEVVFTSDSQDLASINRWLSKFTKRLDPDASPVIESMNDVKQGLVNGILLLSEKRLTFQYMRTEQVEEEIIPIDEIKGYTRTYFEDAWNLTISWGAKTPSSEVTTFTSDSEDFASIGTQLSKLTKRFSPDTNLELESMNNVNTDLRRLALRAGYDLSEIDGHILNITSVIIKKGYLKSALLVLTETKLVVQYAERGVPSKEIPLYTIEKLQYLDGHSLRPKIDIKWKDEWETKKGHYLSSHGDLSSLSLSLKQIDFPVDFRFGDGNSLRWNHDLEIPVKLQEEAQADLEEQSSNAEIHEDIRFNPDASTESEATNIERTNKLWQGLINGILLLSDEHLTFQYKKNGEVEEEIIPIDEIKGYIRTYFEDAWNLRIAWGPRITYGEVTTFTSESEDFASITRRLSELTKRFSPDTSMEIESMNDINADLRQLALRAGYDLSAIDGEILNIANVINNKVTTIYPEYVLLILTKTTLVVQHAEKSVLTDKIPLYTIEKLKYWNGDHPEPEIVIEMDEWAKRRLYSGSHGNLSSLSISLKRLDVPIDFISGDGNSLTWNDDWDAPAKLDEEEQEDPEDQKGEDIEKLDSNEEIHEDTYESREEEDNNRLLEKELKKLQKSNKRIKKKLKRLQEEMEEMERERQQEKNRQSLAESERWRLEEERERRREEKRLEREMAEMEAMIYGRSTSPSGRSGPNPTRALLSFGRNMMNLDQSNRRRR